MENIICKIVFSFAMFLVILRIFISINNESFLYYRHLFYFLVILIFVLMSFGAIPDRF